jgi:hypothetical protein
MIPVLVLSLLHCETHNAHVFGVRHAARALEKMGRNSHPRFVIIYLGKAGGEYPERENL